MDTKVISGFPGVGKSTVFGKRENYRVPILDSDSSTFDKADFPLNYLSHILKETNKGNVILCSSHDTVRQALFENSVPFHLVYPHRSLKMEYLSRYTERGSPEAFVSLMYSKWDDFINGCEEQKGCTKGILLSGQFLSDDPFVASLRKE